MKFRDGQATPGSLLEEIERDALDSNRSVSDALRKCIALGGRAGSQELREWANRELGGYGGEADVPTYRTINAPIVIDGIVGAYHFTGQHIAPMDLPDVAREEGFSEALTLRQSIGELEQHALNAISRSDSVKLLLPGSATLARIMDSEIGDRMQTVHSIYWSIAPTTILGVVDKVRTKLVQLVAQLRSEGADDEPSADTVDNAVGVAVYGRKSRVIVTAAQSFGGGTATVGTSSDQDEASPWWRTTRAVWTFAVGVSTIAAAIIAYLQLSS